MDDHTQQYRAARDNLSLTVTRLQASLERLPDADRDYIDEDDAHAVEDAQESAQDALAAIDSLIDFRNRPTVYDTTMALLDKAVGWGKGFSRESTR